MLNSIFARLILATALVLCIFFGVLDFGANQLFSENVYAAKRSQLKLQSYLLVSSAGIDDNGIFFPEPIPEKRFNASGSGLYGVINNRNGEVLWQSASTQGLSFSREQLTSASLTSGNSAFKQDHHYLIYQRAVSWELQDDQPELLIFNVIEDITPASQQITGYRAKLRRWFIAPAIALVVVMLLTLRFGITPLQSLAKAMKRIEQGQETKLEDNVPIELKAVTQNLNELLFAEKQQRERYQKTLANLAHSIKTPLAVIQDNLEGRSDMNGDDSIISEQVQRIDEIVQHQLQRAVLTTPHTLIEPVSITHCILELIKALEKVYSKKAINFRHDIDADTPFKGDKRDLMEMLGNLMDNACKACVNTVQIKSYSSNDKLIIEIDDDGPGIPDPLKDKVLLRGTRTDSTHPGQGLGLDTVAEIVDSYKGQIHIEKSPMGGAKFKISFPKISG